MDQLRSHVVFAGQQFGVDAGADGSAPGGDLAVALTGGLTRRGFACEEPFEYEGFAWQIDVAQDGRTWLVTAGRYEDPDLGDWLVFVETTGAGGNGLFRKRPPRWTLSDLTPALHAVLTEDLAVQPRWYTAADWDAGPQHEGSTAP